jgi:hypothetical protein
MLHRLFLLAIPSMIGCSAAEAARPEGWVVAEWHSVEQMYRLDPVCEDVRVYGNGQVEARFHTTGELSRWKEFASRDRRFTLSLRQREELVRLLRRAREWRDDPPERTSFICRLFDSGEPCFRDEVELKYAPAPGLEWEHQHSLFDLLGDRCDLDLAFRSHLGTIDAFFRELIWKD